GVQAEGAPDLPRLHHRPEGERVPDGAGREGADGNDPRGGAVSAAGPSQGAHCAPSGGSEPSFNASAGAPRGDTSYPYWPKTRRAPSRASRDCSPRAATTSIR